MAHAQTATVTVTHNDPDGLVDPGQMVEIQVSITTSDLRLFHQALGDVRASPNVGTASNNRFGHTNPSVTLLTVMDPGVVDGAGLTGVVVQSGFTPFFGQPFPPPWATVAPIELVLVKFDWIAPPTPVAVSFDWHSAGGDPVYWVGVTTVALPTTYIGTSLMVVPAPASALLLAAGLWTTRRKRVR
jgi:hypothetical protein